jgi:hypothetical protein
MVGYPPLMASGLDIALSIGLGIGLATAVGFRVFLPLLVVSVAGYTGHLTLAHNFAWLATLPAVTMLSVAATVEVLAYYIPAVDNLLDVAAAPIALVAGVLVSAAVMTDLPPLVKWTAAVIAGGGAAGLTQGATTLLRAKSTAFTAGVGNPVVATAETVGAIILSVLAVLAPLIAFVAVLVVGWLALRGLRKLRP